MSGLACLEAEIGTIARRQLGLLTDAQLRALGLSSAAIRRRIDNGRWARVDRGVLRVVGTSVNWESDVLGRVLAAGEGAVASHRTAAVLHELDGFRRGMPELSVPRGRRYARPGVRTHRSIDLAWVTAVRRSAIPTTPVDRTILDLCAVVPARRVLVAIDDARRRELTDGDQLLECLTLHARRGRGGVRVLRRILDAHVEEAEVTDSGFERLVLVLLAEAGLPTPVLHHRIDLGVRYFEVDLAYPARKLAIELDGSVHLRRDVWERDHGRQNALVLAGWTVLRFTWQNYRRSPDRLVREVRAVLAG